jgi:pimeloyl-ACP methyl ester carboxylesterase
MSVFVMVHGAWHGSWCWQKIVPLLEAKGHSVAAPDLPAHGDDPTPMSDVSLQAYADRVCAVVDAQSEPVVLVGHSLGGVTITQAAETCPQNIRKLVYVSAFLLPNGVARRGYGADIPGSLITDNMVVADNKLFATIKDEGVKPTFYHDCTDKDVATARAMMGPEPMVGIVTPVQYTAARFGRIPRVYVECLDDRALLPELQKRMYTDAGVDQVISMNTSHSPFFAAPKELAGHLHGL